MWKVAVLYNRKPECIAAGLPEDAFEEYDSEETIAAISDAIATLGARPVAVEAGPGLPARLEQGAYDFVFHIAEGEGGRCREAISAAICEFLHLPYTGSDPLTLAVTLDKTVARRVVSPDVPVARAATNNNKLATLAYPVVVKPNAEGSSKGIRQGSYCSTRAAAEAQAEWLRATYGCVVLTEEYLPGMEVTVGIAGNGAGAHIIGMMEIAPTGSSDMPFVYSLEVKREFRTRVEYFRPPRLPESTIEKIRDHALRAYQLLGCLDIARIDFRLDAHGVPHFLECNPLPGLNPESSDLVIATRTTVPYDQLVCGILRDAAARYGLAL